MKHTIKQIGKYPVNIDIEIDNSLNVENELAKLLAKELQKEIDKEITDNIHQQMLKNQGWHQVTVKDYQDITTKWCVEYIKGPYHCFGHYWYFENEKDANYFVLKWGSQ